MTPIWQAHDIDMEFKRIGKTNLTLHTFDNHDHDLNFLQYLLKNEFSDGMKAIFDVAEELK